MNERECVCQTDVAYADVAGKADETRPIAARVGKSVSMRVMGLEWTRGIGERVMMRA